MNDIYQLPSNLYLLHPYPYGAEGLLHEETLSGGGEQDRGQGHLVPQQGL